MTAFEEGYAFFAKQAGVQIAGFEGGTYVGKVDEEIAKLINDLNAFEGFKTKPGAPTATVPLPLKLTAENFLADEKAILSFTSKSFFSPNFSAMASDD